MGVQSPQPMTRRWTPAFSKASLRTDASCVTYSYRCTCRLTSIGRMPKRTKKYLADLQVQHAPRYRMSRHNSAAEKAGTYPAEEVSCVFVASESSA